MKKLILTAVFASLTLTAGWAQDKAPKAGDLLIETKMLKAPDGADVPAELCRLTVPENRKNPDSRLIQIVFVRLKSQVQNPQAPLIYLAGGPGSSSTWMAENERFLSNWLPVLNISDVILLDQRATGKSRPKLVYQHDQPPFYNVFVDGSAARKRYSEIAGKAARHFREQGFDLNGYNSNESADDINDIRLALGLEKVSLYGFSYGTHLALATIRRHGQHLENVIAVGVEGLHQTHKLPLNMDTQFKKLSLMVAKDENVGKFVPDLVALTKRVFDKLDKEPMVVEIYDRASEKKIRIPVGKSGLQYILRRDIGDASDLPVFPKLIYSIDQNDPTLLTWFVQKRWGGQSSINLMGLLFDGASGASPERKKMIEMQAQRSMFGNVANFPWPEIDAATGVQDLGENYRAPLVSDVRTLFLTGTLDWNTPPYQAEQIRWGMTNATHLIVENAGHEQIYTQREVLQAMSRFLQGEDVSKVKVVLPPLKFVPIDRYDPEITHPCVEASRS